MKKKTIVLLLLSLLLTSCADNRRTESNSSCFIKEPVTISLWSMTDEHYLPTLNSFIADFKKAEPNVTVNSKILTGYYNDMEEGVISGFGLDNYPDLVQCYPDHVVDYLDRNKAVNFDTYINNSTYGLNEEDKNDYVASFMEEGQKYSVSGTYSLPWDKSTEVMFYNADVLDNIDLSSYDKSINNGKPLTRDYYNNLTWDEFFGKLCPALKAYDNDHHILSGTDKKEAILTYDSDDNFFITLCQQYAYGYTDVDENGKGKILFDNEKTRTMLKMLHEAYVKGYLQTKNSYNTYTSGLFTSRNALFTISSTTGASYNWSSSAPMNVGVVSVPHATGKDKMCINQGPSLCMLDHNDEQRKLASWLFYKFITNKENSLKWALNTNYMAIRASSYSSEEFKELKNADNKEDKSYEKLNALTITCTEEVQENLFTSVSFKGSSVVRTQVNKVIMPYVFRTDFSEEGLDKVIDESVKTINEAIN